MKSLWLFLLFLFPVLCRAQEQQIMGQDGAKAMWGGAVLGLNFTQVDGDGLGGFHKVGLNLGGTIYLSLKENFLVNMELLFSQKGSVGIATTSNPYSGGVLNKYKLKLNYVELPVLFHYRFQKKYMVGAGASLNALMSHKESIAGSNFVPFDPEQSEFKKLTFDMIFGVSMQFYKNVIGEARYQYGLTPVRDWQNVAPLLPGMGTRNQMNNMVTFRLILLY